MERATTKISTFAFLCCAFVLSGCSCLKDCFFKGDDKCSQNKSFLTAEEIRRMANRHELLLKNYFTYGSSGNVDEYGGGDDVSTLISKTKAISALLKKNGMLAEANKFDSYTDVLMYGNRTIDESMKNVEDLVRNKRMQKPPIPRNCQCPTGACARCLDSILP